MVYGAGQSHVRRGHSGSTYEYDVYKEEPPYVASVRVEAHNAVNSNERSKRCLQAPSFIITKKTPHSLFIPIKPVVYPCPPRTCANQRRVGPSASHIFIIFQLVALNILPYRVEVGPRPRKPLSQESRHQDKGTKREGSDNGKGCA